MLQKLGERTLWKLGVYFLYLCAQVLVLGTLMLTTAAMLAHSLLMLLTLALYFAVCFRDPGTFTAPQQPNLEDISSHRPATRPQPQRKKIVSDQIREADLNDLIGPDPRDDEEEKDKPRPHKKTSIEQRTDTVREEERDSSLKVPENNLAEMAKPDGKIVASAKNIFSAARNVLGNISNYMSKKNIDVSLEEKQAKDEVPKSARSIRAQEEEPYAINVIATQRPEERAKEIEREEREGREEREEREAEEEERAKGRKAEHCQERKGRCAERASKATIGEKMQQKKRYCRMCEFYQPLRVRHCHSCEQCILTFDHHCPWLSTCIGEKNKLAFIAYLFAQTLQFLAISIDLMQFLAEDHSSSGPVAILLLAVVLILLVLVLLLGFHLYLAVNNLTTWELFRWDKVEYLALFDKKLLSSPFSQGWKANLKTLWNATLQDEPKDWSEGLPESLSQFLAKGKGGSRERGGGTERKMFLSQGNL